MMVPPVLLQKNCLACDKPVRGRSDKKFCDDYCRNAYNNYIKATDNRYQRSVNSILARNRRILQSLLGSRDTLKTSRDLLLLNGFSFGYLTHISSAKNGSACYYCYEFGYQALENEQYLLVRNKKTEPVKRLRST